MPQKDRHKDRMIPIEFDFFDTLANLPLADRCSVVLLSCGSAIVKINGNIRQLYSPCALCLSRYDVLEPIHLENLSAKSFHFDPWYIKACLCFDNLEEDVEIESRYSYDRRKLYLFTKHKGSFQGIFPLTPQSYLHINELMLLIGAETYSQSDGFWTCRIRRLLLQLINCIYDIYSDQRKFKFYDVPETQNPAILCAEYIHANYPEKISLEDLCGLVSLNRTSLNRRFKERFGCTCMEYLLNYRLKISQELLSNTNMRIGEIAESCGFRYDTYFIRQFTKRLGVSPAAYRKDPLSYSAYEGTPIRRL